MNSKTAKKPMTALDISASLSIKKKKRSIFLPVLIKYLLVVCGCMGSVFCFLSCIDLPVDTINIVLTALAVGGLFTFTLNLKEKLWGIASTAAAAVFLIMAAVFRYEICGGIANTTNVYLSRVRQQFRSEPLIPLAEPELAAAHTNVFFCFFTAFICIMAAYFIAKSVLAVGLCMPLLAPPIAVMLFGLEPNYLAFGTVVAVCAAAIALELSSSEKIMGGKYRFASAYNGLAAAIAAIICFGGVTAAVKISGYERSQKLDNMYDSFTGYVESGEMKTVIEEIVTIAAKKTGQSGAINHGKLGELDDIFFENETVLQVTIPKSDETVYLRGFVGSVYTGKSWEQLPNSKLRQLGEITENFTNEGLSPLLFDSYNLKYARDNLPKYSPSLPQYSFAVKNISASRSYLYMPYNLVPESVSRYSIQNDSSFRGGENSYIGKFYDPSGYYGYQSIFKLRWNMNSVLAADEAAYRQFVYSNYLDLPDDFSYADRIFSDSYYEYITAEEVQTGKSTLDEMTVFSRKLYYIKMWLRNNCRYSLNAGKLPAGEDFVEHFLTDQKGSCSHFASAAALMCRYAGIPARYVEGYIIKPSDFPASAQTGSTVSVDVTDARGHAWVEIYIDGFGWYPMEFTSGYGNVRTALPTETVIAETEEEITETEITNEENGEAESETTVISDGNGENVQQTTAVNQESVSEAAENSEIETKNSIIAEETSVTDLQDIPEESDTEFRKPTVGFGIFGIKAGKKSDIVYDLTTPFVVLLVVVLIPIVFVLRRRAVVAVYRKKCALGKKTAVLTAYRRFGRIVKLMELPVQGGLDYGEYAVLLSERSKMLSYGVADTIINTALKASFGGGQLTEDETDEMVSCVNTIAKSYYLTLSGVKKAIFKYWYCIV